MNCRQMEAKTMTETKFANFIVVATAYFFLLYGIGFILFPHQMTLFVTDMVLTTTSAVTDIRATYGGMSLAAGTTLLLLTKRDLQLALLAVGLLLLSMAFGRTVGMVLDGNSNPIIWLYWVGELLFGAIALLLRQRLCKYE